MSMADPRELARQAFNMLQNALATSEARAEQLNEELTRKPVSKDKLANQVSVLSHRLEGVEEECARWKREAEQLEEVLANERVKFESLKKKLEIAESGPEKLTRKEINYWRANAEKFDEQINAYKSRIAALKRELREKDTQLASGQTDASAPSERTEHNSSVDAEALAQYQSEISSLRQQIAGLNAVLADTHSTRERLEAELASLRERLDQAEQNAASAPQIDPGLTQEIERARQENTQLRSSLQMSEAGLHELRRAREDLAHEVADLRRQLDADRGQNQEHARQHQLLAAQLEESRTREAALQTDLEASRQALTAREQEAATEAVSSREADDLKAELGRARQESADLRAALNRSESELHELRDTREGLAAELAEVSRRLEQDHAQVAEAQRREQAIAAELEHVRQSEAALQAELDDTRRASDGHQETTQALNDAISNAERRALAAEAKLADLETELKEEREYSENLSELANGRQDEIVKLQDSVEEARERLDDALWRLQKAKYFERLVARRKGLIGSLIEALRAKNKAMMALKAGLDSMRTHKAIVEETQQKLIVRLEALKNELSAAKERIKAHETEAATMSQRKPGDSDVEIAALQERLTTQAELIQSLEDEIKAAKAYKRNAEEKDGEVAQLHEELETKNTIIARLQADLDDQQRKLAKLRGSDGETMRLKALTEQDRSKIDVLERENAELRAMIESAEQSQPAGGELTDEREIELQAKIAELTESVAKWKKKYEFLSTEAPAAYQTQSAAKQ